VEFELKPNTNQAVEVFINVPLFEWVIENLSKNALDAMNGKGKLSFFVFSMPERIIIDIQDTGKGIPQSQFRQVFLPGFTTKKRGWGLGLTLVKRIVEQYHQGRIFVKHSTVGKGTTFRIVLPIHPKEEKPHVF
jgi:signal transduction histidine kinase